MSEVESAEFALQSLFLGFRRIFIFIHCVLVPNFHPRFSL